MTCNSVHSVIIEISGGGSLSISPNCEIHTINSILLSRKNNIQVYLYLIPENLNTDSLSHLAENFKCIITQNITNVKVIKDSVDLTR